MDYRFDVEGKVAIITGGARGIGKTIAASLLSCGASVVVADMQIEENALAKMASAGAGLLALETDVTRPESVRNMVEKTLQEFGEIHVLINNAGIIYKSLVEEIDIESWKRVVDVNLTGPVICTKAVVPQMKTQKWGRIINLSSMQAHIGTPSYSAYSATKAGLSELTKVWAAELAPFQVTVNAICPSYVETSMMKRSVERLSEEKAISQEEALAHFIDPIPQKRLLKPEEIAFIVLFLSSSLAQGITGDNIVVAAGYVMH
jgi:NAD(P)-dependent dehydrogenase (short-subunit alcohol dehydrogenase family)